ncbi:FecR family protein [Chitinophaga defluvii]|uniref:FecR domain-containing protein n=1 Tax=Chitinophaga defluvii TaxID=3163343 RepID=A0ABV2TCC8_9BACT
MTTQELKDLLERFEQGTCSEEEKQRVQRWYLEDAEEVDYSTLADFPEASQRIMNRLSRKRSGYSIKTWAIAAAVLALLSVSSAAYYYLLIRRPMQMNESAQILPGGNKAILTLSNGTAIRLDDLVAGSMRQEGEMTIEKTQDGTIRYSRKSGAANELTNALNTITTPRGGQYQVVLPDGTKVWLNAATKLTYPVSFTGRGTREVVLGGEAYFEVAKDKMHPFIVKSTDQIITVTGTHFHVSCYLNEPQITTLAEGSVQVFQPGTKKTQKLKPGQQTILSKDGIRVNEVNPEDFIAWKDGSFVFDQTPIRQVLQQISRWYDVDVDYSNLPDEYFDGDFPRSVKLPELLQKIQETSNIKIVIEGRRIRIK